MQGPPLQPAGGHCSELHQSHAPTRTSNTPIGSTLTRQKTGVQTQDELKSKTRDILKRIQNNFFSAFVYILLFL
ncbi:hypothetical protein NQZ68_031199 [Dissostichus eleginoides]|nr:hypothetical protein NQZ68_031199 [Dissostichus eleginoides]